LSHPFSPSNYVERLALGIEPRDALRELSLAYPIQAVFDGVPGDGAGVPGELFELERATRGLAPLPRRSGGRFAVLDRPGLPTQLSLRLCDPSRRFVPRRIRYSIPADITVREPRIRRPVLYPGASYELSETATGIRGRAVWAGADALPARFTRVEASVAGNVVGRAHGDDRGEFLLLLDSNANGPGQLRRPFVVMVSVFGPALPPTPADPSLPRRDPLWDLPLEVVPLLGADTVSPGFARPAGYTTVSQRDVTFTVGRLRSEQDVFVLTP
jgi:hypothetical protein